MLVDRYGNPLQKIRTTNASKIVSGSTDRARLTTDRNTFGPFSTFGDRSYTKATDKVDWKLQFVEEETLASKSANDLVNILIHSSPDLSRARTDMQALLNTKFTLTTEEADPAAQTILDEALVQMERIKEPLTVKLNKWISSMFLKGALYSECIFAGPPGEERFIDIRVVDPFRVAYMETESEERGQYQAFGEVRNGEFVPIESDLVQYIPINPVDDHPLGIPMIGSAIFPIIFLLGVLKSLRQVIETQAWPQGLITIDNEKRLKGLGYGNPDARSTATFDQDEFEQDLDELVEDIETRFHGASKSEVFIYGAEVAYQIVGSMSKANLDAVEMVQRVLDKWILRGLKQFNVTFGITEGNALSTNATQEAELLARQSDALQSEIERLLTIHFNQILLNAGNSSTAVFQLERFNALVQKERAELQYQKQQTISLLLKDRIITQQLALTLTRDPNILIDFARLLPPEIDPSLLQPEEPEEEASNAEEESESEEEEET